MIKRLTILLWGVLGLIQYAQAYVVHLVQQVEVDGAIVETIDQMVETGDGHTTLNATERSGYIFTHWTTSAVQEFSNRDYWGRAYNQVVFSLYEPMTNTAHYVRADTDEDADGIPDGKEIYWYGNLNQTRFSDTDGDGIGLEVELAHGLNPHFPDEWQRCFQSTSAMPRFYKFTMRSEPEGALFETVTNEFKHGVEITTGSYSPDISSFSHWVINGASQRDAFGRALEQINFVMPPNDVELVAVTIDDEEKRQAVYWHGDASNGWKSDVDGDGLTLREELILGHNPLFFDEDTGGIKYTSRKPKFFKLVLRSEPEGVLFETETRNVAPGTMITTQSYNPSSSQFAYWVQDGMCQRDMFGRALDQICFEMPTNDVEVVAVAIENEEERHGVYWYGNKENGWQSDTDGDGMTLREEVVRGLNPHFADGWVKGLKTDSLTPKFFKLIMRSQPEGALFASVTNEIAPEVVISTEAYSPDDSIFTHWTINGVSQRDMFGRALDKIRFKMPTNDVEVVAFTAEDEEVRQSVYWHGDAENGWSSDVDGDGLSLREELLRGLNPLFADCYVGGVKRVSQAPEFYTLVLRSEPEGALFATVTNEVAPGLKVSTPSYSVDSSVFAHWLVNGVSQRDAFGRAHDFVELLMPPNDVEIVAVAIDDDEKRQAVYWHGSDVLGWDSDVDGDELSLRMEVQGGTNPIFFDDYTTRGVRSVVSEELEVDLQPFEQMRGTIVDGEYSELFTSPLAGNEEKSRDFGDNASPLAVDVNGDGLFDVVVVSRGGVTVLLNKGAAANPNFSEAGLGSNWDNFKRLIAGMVKPIICGDGAVIYVSDDGGAIYKFTIDDGTVVETGLYGIPALLNGKLIALTAEGIFVCADAGEKVLVDTPVIEGISVSTADLDADGRMDILVADKVGHIWLYRNISTPTEIRTGTNSFKLLHKVWAGTGVGFGEGMSISLVDWEDDGDYDVVIGTADGKLMLLRDPKTGRPTNVRATAGATSVLLEWDPNSQPRIRGYNVYRSPDAESYSRIVNQTPLPRYRDVPNILQDYWYRITGVSRFYIAGNSTPTVHESMPTDAVYVQFRPSVWLNDTSSFTETNVEVVVSMNNSMGISAEGLSMTFTYDPAVLEPVEMKASGLTADMTLSSSGGNGTWTMRATGGEIKTGSGIFTKLVFYVKGVHDVTKTVVTLNAATVKALDGHAVTLELPKSATIEIADSHPLVPAVVAVDVADAAVESETEFVLPVTVASSETLTNFMAEVAYDESMLRFDGWSGTIGGEDLALKFYVYDPKSVVTNFATAVSLTNIVVVDCNGFTVNAADATAIVLIKNAHPLVPAIVSVSTEAAKVDTLTEFELPVTVTSNEELKSGAFTVEYDPAVLEWRGEVSALVGTGVLNISATESFALKFYAKDQHDVAQTSVRITEATVTDIHDFVVKPSVPVVATVLIHDANPLLPPKVTMSLSDVSVKTEQEFEMVLSIATTEALKALEMDIQYDTGLLELKSGVLSYSDGVPASVVLTFYAKENHTVTKTAVTILPKTGVGENGLAAELPAEVIGNVILADSNPWKPAEVSVGIGGAKVDTLTEFSLPVTITSNEELKSGAFTVTYDPSVLEWRGESSAFVEMGKLSLSATENYAFKFYAKDQHDITQTAVTITDATVVDIHDFTVKPSVPVVAMVLIHDANPLLPPKVTMTLQDVAVKTETEFTMALSISTTEPLKALAMTLDYDSSLLEFKSGVLTYSDGVPGSVLLKFYAKENHTVTKTVIKVKPVSGVGTNGLAAELPAEVVGNVILADSNPWKPAEVSVGIGGAKVDTLTEFMLPVMITSNEELKGGAFTVTYDPAVLEWRGESSAFVEAGRLKLSATEDFTLKFYAKDQHNVTQTAVTITDATVVDIHDFAVKPSVPVVATVLIHDANPLLPPKVSMTLQDVAVKTETEFAMTLSISTTEPLKALALDIEWDEDLLELRRVGDNAPSQSTDGRAVCPQTAELTDVGNKLTLTFYAKENHTVTKTTVKVKPVSSVGANGLAAELPIEVIGNVILADSNPWKPAEVSVGIAGAKVDTLTEFTLPVTITSNEELKSGAFTVTYDPSVLEWRGESSALVGTGRLKLSATEDFALKFYAKDQHDITQTAVTITDATVVDIHDFTVKPFVPVVATVLIRDSKPLVPAGVILNLADAHIETCHDFSVPITVTTTKELKNLSVKVGYDTSIFEFKGCVGGTWNNGIITAQGSVPRTIILTFHAKDQHTVTQSKMTLSGASARCTDDLVATVTTTDGMMYITDSNVPVPVSMTVATWHVKTKSGAVFKLPIGATTTGGLKEFVVTVEWDGTYLTYIGAPSASSATKIAANKYRFTFPCTGEYNLFNLDFKATEISGLQQNASIRLTEASGTGENNLAATVTTRLPVESTVMIVREIGKYSSGDVDGDGRYTDNDHIILNGYVIYLTMLKYGAAVANNYASQYQLENHVNIKLTGKAAKAADVNVDGKVDASDISMLQMLIREAEGAGL